jgi:Bacterial PH domain
MEDSITFVGQVATVTLIAVATRWLLTVKGDQLPKVHGGISVYRTKWQWRILGLTGGLLFTILAVKIPVNMATVAGWISLAAFPALALLAFWLAIGGSVTIDQSGITKKGLLRSQSLRWGDITELRLHTKQGGAIKLCAGLQKLVIDSRFSAFQHLLNEIKDQTKLRPSTK